MRTLKQTLEKIMNALSLPENRPKIFYLAAFAPLMLVMYSYAAWPFDIAIPLYGFILLVIKKPKLFAQEQANKSQRLFGLLIMFASFLLYFPIAPQFPDAAFYGVANYSVYILGLFLLFFNVYALREAFAPLFLIIATTLTSFASVLAEAIFSPFIVPNMASLTVGILRSLGIRTDAFFTSAPIITIHTPRGLVSASFIWGCVGFASAMIFSIMLVILLSEESCSLRTKILWSTVGLTGVFFLNIARVVLIFVTDYFYGYEAGAQIHYVVGYAIFITWISVFLYAFYRRQAKKREFKENPPVRTFPENDSTGPAV